MCRILFIACSLALLLAMPAVAREWSDASGKFKIEAELADINAATVRLKRPGGEIASVPLARLSPADQDYVKSSLARSAAAAAVLKKHCYACHGNEGSDEGGMNYILNGARLVEKGQVLARQPDKSVLLKRIAEGKMPPADVPLRPSKEEVETLREWVTQGAFSPSGTAAREFVTTDKVLAAVAEDLAAADERSRVFYRYFSITHLYNAGLAEEELHTLQLALSKLLNSLSWDRKILTPTPIDPNRTVYRIDVRDLRWTRELWEALSLAYPYNIQYSGKTALDCYKLSSTRTPVLRADWFVAEASSGPLYHALLQVPDTVEGLQRQLKVSFSQNLRQDRANRAGFTNSGISLNPRVIERHETSDGACWVSYDFAASAGTRNFFNNPLSFDYDGGEIIFSLPNGLQAYMVIDREGRRLEKAPTKIVRDLKSRDATVVNGISCMRCHASGILPKHDEVRVHARANSKAFGAETLKTILALYPEHDVLDKQIKEDQDRFRDALAKIGITRLSAEGEPIYNTAQRFQEPLDLRLASAEVGKTPEEFHAALDKLVSLQKQVGPLRIAGSTVPRDVYEEAYGTLVSSLAVGRYQQPGARIIQAGDVATAETRETERPEPSAEPSTTVDDPLGAPGAGDVRLGLVHQWKFDETKGDVARDAVGKNNASLVNFAKDEERWVKGKLGNALRFSQAEHVVYPAKDVDFPQLTITFWLNAQLEKGTNPRIVSPWVNLNYEQRAGVGLFGQVWEPGKPEPGEWHHYAVSIDRLKRKAIIYRNGDEVASGKITKDRDPTRLAFGHNVDIGNHGDSFNGMIDDLRIYRRLLTAADVAKLAGSGVTEESP